MIQIAWSWLHTSDLFEAFVPTGSEKIIQIALGSFHNCALFESGRIKCWGRNDHGQLGYGDTQTRNKPSEKFVPTGSTKIIKISLGDGHTCALFEGGFIKCWGKNDQGQLGYGDTLDRDKPPEEYLKLEN